MNSKTAKQLRKIALQLTSQICSSKNVPVVYADYIELTRNRKKAQKIKDGIDKKEVREYEWKKSLGMPKDAGLEDKYYDTYDISLGTLRLSDICVRKIYKNLKKQISKNNLNKSQFALIK